MKTRYKYLYAEANYEIRKEYEEEIYFGSGVLNLYYRLFSGNLFSEVFNNKYSNNYSVSELINNVNKNFLLVGTLETFDYFLVFLKKKLKWNFFDIRHSKNNISKPNVSYNNLDKKIIKEIEILNSNDMALYERAKIKFEREYGNIKKNKNFIFFQNFNKFYNILNFK